MSGTKAIVGQVGTNSMLDKVEKGTDYVKDYLSAQDKAKYDQATAAIYLLGAFIKNKVRSDGVFHSTIADLRNVKEFDDKKLIDPFSQNGQFIKYQIVPAGRGAVDIYSLGPNGKDDGGRNLSWNGRSGDIMVTFDGLYPLEPKKTDVEKYGKEYETLPVYSPPNRYFAGSMVTRYFDEAEKDINKKEARILYSYIFSGQGYSYTVYRIITPYKDEQEIHTYEIRYNIKKKVLWKIVESYDKVEKRWKYEHGIIENVNIDQLRSFCLPDFPILRLNKYLLIHPKWCGMKTKKNAVNLSR